MLYIFCLCFQSAVSIKIKGLSTIKDDNYSVSTFNKNNFCRKLLRGQLTYTVIWCDENSCKTVHGVQVNYQIEFMGQLIEIKCYVIDQALQQSLSIGILPNQKGNQLKISCLKLEDFQLKPSSSCPLDQYIQIQLRQQIIQFQSVKINSSLKIDLDYKFVCFPFEAFKLLNQHIKQLGVNCQIKVDGTQKCANLQLILDTFIQLQQNGMLIPLESLVDISSNTLYITQCGNDQVTLGRRAFKYYQLFFDLSRGRISVKIADTNLKEQFQQHSHKQNTRKAARLLIQLVIPVGIAVLFLMGVAAASKKGYKKLATRQTNY